MFQLHYSVDMNKFNDDDVILGLKLRYTYKPSAFSAPVVHVLHVLVMFIVQGLSATGCNSVG